MSTRLSPDGMYYWDGAQWVSTLAHDGRSRWNGTAWVPTGQLSGAAVFQPPAHTVREPTSWTRPLQLTVAAFYVLQGLYALSLPLWMSGPITQVVNQSVQRQEQLHPTATPPPADFVNTMTSLVGGFLWVAAVIGLVIAVVAVIGALSRWTWVYYVVLVLLGLGAVSLPLNLVNAAGGSAITGTSGISLPAWTNWLGLVSGIPGTALFVWMVVALAKRGPWAMRKAPQTS